MSSIKRFLKNAGLLTCTSLLMRTVGVGFSVYISGKVGAEAIGL